MMFKKFDTICESVLLFESSKEILDELRNKIIEKFKLKDNNVSKIKKLKDGTARLRLVVPDNKELKDNVIFIDFKENVGYTLNDMDGEQKLDEFDEVLDKLEGQEFETPEGEEPPEKDEEEEEANIEEEPTEEQPPEGEKDKPAAEEDPAREEDVKTGEDEEGKPFEPDNAGVIKRPDHLTPKPKETEEEEEIKNQEEKIKKGKVKKALRGESTTALKENVNSMHAFKKAAKKLGLDVEYDDSGMKVAGGKKRPYPKKKDGDDVLQSTSKGNNFMNNAKEELKKLIPDNQYRNAVETYEMLKTAFTGIFPEEEYDTKKAKTLLKIIQDIYIFIQKHDNVNNINQALDYYEAYETIFGKNDS